MEWAWQLVDFILHFDQHLDVIIQRYGAWTYGILAGIIFLETGLVITPILPGDSLLFAAGVFAGRGSLNPHLLFVLLSLAAILGDSVNYAIGKYLGPRIPFTDDARIFKRRYLEKTREYFARYGGVTIIIARFVPIVRTFAPFVAGIGTMNYPTFFLYNVVGGIMWVSICVYAGYWFGQWDVVKENFELVVLGIVFVSILPGLFEMFRQWRLRRAAAGSPMDP